MLFRSILSGTVKDGDRVPVDVRAGELVVGGVTVGKARAAGGVARDEPRARLH